nr:retrovirus-related Pol polyprotein from transposon TNT 1-94 [Tanacetum cinerariifolium]
GIENQINHKVKIGIKREFSVARTPQQNGVAERKNRTLIEAASTMLADSLLPIPFWAEAVNTACYVQNKAFRVFNSKTRIVQETLHINFLENKPNVAGIGPKWLFDIDTLTMSMNYQPVVAGNQPNDNSDPHNTDDDVADAAFDVKKNENDVLVFANRSDRTDNKKHNEKAKKDDKGHSPVDSPIEVMDLRAEFEEFSFNSSNRVNVVNAPVNAASPSVSPTNSTNSFNTASPSVNAISLNFGIADKSLFVDPSKYPDDPDMPELEDIIYSDDEEDVRTEADLSNLETNIPISPIPTTRGHTQEEGIDYNEVFAPVVRIEAIRLFLAYASLMGFMVYQMDVKSAFLYGTIKEEVYVCQPQGFKDPDYPDKVYKVVKVLYGLHQAPRACQDKYVAEISRKFGFTDVKSASTPIETEKPLLKDPDGCRLISWQYEKQNVVAISSTEAKYVATASSCAQVLWIQNQLPGYRHFITAVSYELILFGLLKVVAVNLMLLGHKLMLSRTLNLTSNFSLLITTQKHNGTSQFADTHNMVAFLSKSNASDGFDQIVDFLNAHTIKYALVVNPTIYVSCIKQFWAMATVKKVNDDVQLRALIDGKKVVVSEAIIRRDLHLDDADGVECLSNDEIFEELARMGYERLHQS